MAYQRKCYNLLPGETFKQLVDRFLRTAFRKKWHYSIYTSQFIFNFCSKKLQEACFAVIGSLNGLITPFEILIGRLSEGFTSKQQQLEIKKLLIHQIPHIIKQKIAIATKIIHMWRVLTGREGLSYNSSCREPHTLELKEQKIPQIAMVKRFGDDNGDDAPKNKKNRGPDSIDGDEEVAECVVGDEEVAECVNGIEKYDKCEVHGEFLLFKTDTCPTCYTKMCPDCLDLHLTEVDGVCFASRHSLPKHNNTMYYKSNLNLFNADDNNGTDRVIPKPEFIQLSDSQKKNHQMNYATGYFGENSLVESNHLNLLLELLLQHGENVGKVAFFNPEFFAQKFNLVNLNICCPSYTEDIQKLAFFVNENSNHWVIYLFDKETKSIKYINTILNKNGNQRQPKPADLKQVRQHITDIFDLKASSNTEIVKIPKEFIQTDDNNCGVLDYDIFHLIFNGIDIENFKHAAPYRILVRRRRFRSLLNQAYYGRIDKEDLLNFYSKPNFYARPKGVYTNEEHNQLLKVIKTDIISNKSNGSDDDAISTSDDEIEIIDDTDFRLTQLNDGVLHSNGRKKALTEKEFDKTINECKKETDVRSACYLLTFKNPLNDAAEMLENGFYYGFSEHIVLTTRLKEHIRNAKIDKGPLSGLSEEQLNNVIIIPINIGLSTVNRLYEALYIRLEPELPPVLKNRKFEEINNKSIENLINFHSNQRQHIISILRTKLERAITVAIKKLPPPSLTHLPPDVSRFDQLLAILHNENKCARERLLTAIDCITERDEIPHHCYAVIVRKENVSNMKLVYFGITRNKIKERRYCHTKTSAIYDIIQKESDNDVLFIPLIWENANATKAKIMESLYIYFGFNNRLPKMEILNTTSATSTKEITENIDTKIQNRKLEPLSSKHLKKILLNHNGIYTAELNTIIEGLSLNIAAATTRFLNAQTDTEKEELEFITYNCRICKLPFKSNSSLARHISEKHNPNFQRLSCLDKSCTTTFMTRENRNRHCEEQHSIKSPKFQCFDDECDKIYESSRSRDRHFRHSHCKNMQKIICDECNKSFLTNQSKNRHFERIHAKIPPKHQCDECTNVYTSWQSLQDHKKYYHRGEQITWYCFYPGCTKKYLNDKRLRNRHIRIKHPRFVYTHRPEQALPGPFS